MIPQLNCGISKILISVSFSETPDYSQNLSGINPENFFFAPPFEYIGQKELREQANNEVSKIGKNSFLNRTNTLYFLAKETCNITANMEGN